MRDLAQRVPDDGVHHTVDVHALPDGRVRVGDHTFSAKEFADVLRRDPGYDGGPIRLLSCDAGTSGLARDLSRELGVPVTAPRGLAWTDGNGRVFASDMGPDGRPGWPPNGSWDTHHPDGTDTPTGNDGFHPSHDGEDPGPAPDDAAARGDEEQSLDRDTGFVAKHPDELPPDPSRPHVLETLDRNDCVPSDPADGPITHYKGQPIEAYVRDVMTDRNKLVRQQIEDGSITPADWRGKNVEKWAGKNVQCLSVSIDRQTGRIYESINGPADKVVPNLDSSHPSYDPKQNLHPVMRERLDSMRSTPIDDDPNTGYVQPDRRPDANGDPIMRDGKPWRTEFPNPSPPLNHAEVKNLNQMLIDRGVPHDISPADLDRVLGEMRVDNTFPHTGKIPNPAACCANCHRLVAGVPSSAGRLPYPPGHRQYEEIGPE
ncbi:YwqJ-related putative deaminase [Saccharopolyspora sp. NFXS83]|uniref:YwqJ-related putative deaminase n=1 Tax=Saccharopolyspora sp. NFXS83 TaxID=2993560 RepID=UPI00224AB7FC|nr:YwqJ-related putative deaminase [Saccharopolyspora sp. NFXS83]MCX2733974.1 YwqJ-related putative deaminase [Saccharopolyspora sp. NFXS83]